MLLAAFTGRGDGFTVKRMIAYDKISDQLGKKGIDGDQLM